MSGIRDRIRSRDFRKRDRVEAFGETVGVRQLSVVEQREYRKATAAAESADGIGRDDVMGELLVLANLWGAVDPDTGDRMFGPEDEEWLRAQPPEALIPVTRAFVKINGFSAAAEDAAEGNSSATPSEGSPSA